MKTEELNKKGKHKINNIKYSLLLTSSKISAIIKSKLMQIQ